MRWGAFVALSMVVAGGRMAVAEQRGVESAEEFQRVCESTLDDLLHGNAAGLETLFRADSEAGFRAFSDRLRRQYESNQQDRGEPLDWKFLGTRQIGTGLRQYLYVCRYTRMPIIWRFAAVEQEGRWILGFGRAGRQVAVGVQPVQGRIDRSHRIVPPGVFLDLFPDGDQIGIVLEVIDGQ